MVRDVAFMAGEKKHLKVSPMKRMMKFGKKGRLSLGFVGPFDALERVGKVSYRLALLSSLSGLHPLFHVSMLQKHYQDKSHVLDFSTVRLEENLTYEKELVAILDRQVRMYG
ncbi:uncharacterized protein [Nicotiana tomentosiformis]|uniref:uncharacterized protein n=1 Tax=Nicotiana tomentosiformis TaxID=4098 RepID=UPI00388CA788